MYLVKTWATSLKRFGNRFMKNMLLSSAEKKRKNEICPRPPSAGMELRNGSKCSEREGFYVLDCSRTVLSAAS